ncbi:ABC transporter permease [Bacteroidia bacterium]|nr:ABC transporter permease [Bacteroidia bacterium]GHT03021.1 ABC transporter permease [Bacteroidia bacterium]GHT46347.1 ABC transporter permease [Bacteroidia bacterium]
MEILTVPIQESLIYMLAVYGVYILFKTLKFPDISVDNVFSLGSMGGAFLLVNTNSLTLTLGGTFILGFLIGALTATLFVYIKIPKLFAGIITYTILFSINLKFFGKSNISLGKDLFYSSSEILWIIIAVDILALSGLLYLLKTILGKNLVSVGTNPNVLKEFGASYPLLLILGVGLCDALISTSGFLTSIYFRFSDTSLGIGILVNSVAAVILSQFIINTYKIKYENLSILIGIFLYNFILYFVISYMSFGIFDHTDYKLISGLVIVVFFVFNKRSVKEIVSF